MFLINEKVVIDLTQYVDLTELTKLKPYIDYAIVKGDEYQVPSQYDGDIFLDQGLGFMNVNEDKKLELIKKYPYINEFDHKHLLMWLRYHYDIKYGQSHLHVIKSRDWKTKHLKDHCDHTEVTELFRPFLNWLDKQNIFSSYGRVNVFVNEPLSITPIHFDPPTNKVSSKDQFILIKIDGRKKIFVYNEDTQEKVYLPGAIGTFDNYNYHGSDQSEFASWSIRVDGLFTKEFMDKSGMGDHFTTK